MEGAVSHNKQGGPWLHIGMLAALVLIAYSKVFHAGFMNWDDLDYVFHTPDISSGIGWEQVSNWFTKYYIGNYQPLPVATYALDHLIGGSDPFVYHLDSILWHIAAAISIYVFISRLQGNRWIAFFTALLFALHPVQTESVSWIAARNKGMNAVFFFSALTVYVSYVRVPTGRRLLWVCVLGVLAYLCKATAVALPLTLFAVDIWLLRPLGNKKVWLEKLPLVLLALPVIWATLDAQRQVSFLEHRGSGISLQGMMYAGHAYVQYLQHLVFPYRLSVLYPYPQGIEAVHIIGLLAALAIGALIIIAYRKGWFVLSGGLLFFSVNILPLLQFVQFGEVLMADRYLYVAAIGIFFPLVWYLFHWLQRPRAAIATGGVVAALLLALTFVRNDIWLSELNFWSAIVDKFPESPVAQYSMGAIYMKAGDYPAAESHINMAVSLDPNNYKALYNKGALYLREGKPMESLDALNKCLAITEYTKAYFSRAMLYQGTGKPGLAIADAGKVLQYQPENARAYYILGDCQDQLGNTAVAMDSYNKAIAYEDNEPLFYIRRGLLLAKAGNTRPALTDLDRAVSLSPASGQAWYYRGIIKYKNGLPACDDFRQALAHGYAQAREAIGQACGQ